MPPATAVNFIPWALVGFLFQYVIRRRHFAFWTKYNCELALASWQLHLWPMYPSDVLSAALDAGTSISTILIYFMYSFINYTSLPPAHLDWTVYNILWMAKSAKTLFRLGGVTPCFKTQQIGLPLPSRLSNRMIRPLGRPWVSVSLSSHVWMTNRTCRPQTWWLDVLCL